MELLDRICPNPAKAEILPRQRIKRTISNMNCLTETLLWLGMDASRIPEPEKVALDGLVEELAAQIAEKSGWHYTNRAIPGGREATLEFPKAQEARPC